MPMKVEANTWLTGRQ